MNGCVWIGALRRNGEWLIADILGFRYKPKPTSGSWSNLIGWRSSADDFASKSTGSSFDLVWLDLNDDMVDGVDQILKLLSALTSLKPNGISFDGNSLGSLELAMAPELI